MARSSERKKEQRKRLRDEGFRPLEIWLPSDLIDKLDAMKAVEDTTRDAVIMALMQDTLGTDRPVRTKDQLALL